MGLIKTSLNDGIKVVFPNNSGYYMLAQPIQDVICTDGKNGRTRVKVEKYKCAYNEEPLFIGVCPVCGRLFYYSKVDYLILNA